ncbi:related to NSE4 Nuclear protein that plays a role in the function of the Smc5p-Rhc18p DNA repair complex [Phialocephala subalpina]|uniref:Non-structural maintenance of chromosomes element 4 n=1 Tax=Phialocephala subalpina TaxID=576137 RepID=A0A1L7XFC3_9HELO|nr:related to NSE4 Nuclear protein that plays a role in the function of the Smc5p-Rhc18p DNA repair complex [Phialocephala subalpina]
MARLAKMSESPAPGFGDDIYEASPLQVHDEIPTSRKLRYKENLSSRPAVDKGKGRAPIGPPSAPSIRDGNSRKRAAEQEQFGDRSRRRQTVEIEEDTSEVEYDPDQNIEERRKLRKGLRDLNKNLVENRAEFLAPKSTGLRDTIRKANELSLKVKQTSDATIDSRLLVTAADYSLKKTNALISGDNAQGIDILDFLMKVKQYMRLGAPGDEAPTATQRHHRDGADSDDEDDGETWNWEYFGRHACVKHIARPSVPGFLLGPLSVEKRVRAVTVRTQRLQHKNIQEVRPEVLQAGDIEKNENANLTTLCTQIMARLKKVQQDAIRAVEDRTRDDMTDKECDELMDEYGVSREGGLALFKFVINPRSFGQTIENMFYVSFLIRDGKLGISVDNRGLPYLNETEARSGAGEGGRGKDSNSKHQAVLALDMREWQDLIEAFDIKEPMIKHRVEEEHAAPAKGWYA